MHVRIKQFEKDMEAQAALQGVMATEVEEGDALLEDNVEEEGFLEDDNSTSPTSQFVDTSPSVSLSTSNSGDGWSQDDTGISEKTTEKAKAKAKKRDKKEQDQSGAIISSESKDEQEAIAKAKAKKREKKKLQQSFSSESEDEEIAIAKAKGKKREKNALQQTSSSESEDEAIAIAEAKAEKREEQDGQSTSSDEEIELGDVSSQLKDNISGAKVDHKKKKHSIRGASATTSATASDSFEEESLSSDELEEATEASLGLSDSDESVEEYSAMSDKKDLHKQENQKDAAATFSEGTSDSLDGSKDSLSASGDSDTAQSKKDGTDKSEEGASKEPSSGSLQEPGVSLDEDGPDVQVLSVHSSFVISNVDGILAKDVDTSPTGNLQKAYKQFLIGMLSTVCDKAGEHYKHCGREGGVKPHAASKIKFDDESSSSEDYEKSWDAIVDSKEKKKVSTKKKKSTSTINDKTDSAMEDSWDALADPKHKDKKPEMALNKTTEESIEHSASGTADASDEWTDAGDNDFGTEEEDVLLEVDVTQRNTTTNSTLGHKEAAEDSQEMLDMIAEDAEILENHTKNVAEAFRGKDGKSKVEAAVQNLVDQEEITEEESKNMLSVLEGSNYTAAPNATGFNLTLSDTKEVDVVEEEFEEDAAASNGLLSYMLGEEEAEEEEEITNEDSSETEKNKIDEEFEEDAAASNGLLSYMFGEEEEAEEEEETTDEASSETERNVEAGYEENAAASSSLLGFMLSQEEEEDEVETEAPKKEKKVTKPSDGRGKNVGSNRRMVESVTPVSGVSLLDVELYEIHDTDCPMDYATTGKPNRCDVDLVRNNRRLIHSHFFSPIITGGTPLCQTIYAHYDLLVLNLDGDVDEIEENYMLVTETATNEGLLEKSLEAVSDTSAYTVEQAGSKPFTGSKHKNTGGAEAARVNMNDEWREVDPALDSLLATGGYAKQHQEVMLEAEDGYDERVITQYDRLQPREQFSAATSVGQSAILVALNLLAYIMF